MELKGKTKVGELVTLLSKPDSYSIARKKQRALATIKMTFQKDQLKCRG